MCVMGKEVGYKDRQEKYLRLLLVDEVVGAVMEEGGVVNDGNRGGRCVKRLKVVHLIG